MTEKKEENYKVYGCDKKLSCYSIYDQRLLAFGTSYINQPY